MTFYRARFRAELVDDDLIAVVDLNLINTKSVTNDIERVVATIAEYVTIGDRQIVYRDSMGMWDGVLVAKGKFLRFVALQTIDRDKAVDFFRRYLGREGVE